MNRSQGQINGLSVLQAAAMKLQNIARRGRAQARNRSRIDLVQLRNDGFARNSWCELKRTIHEARDRQVPPLLHILELAMTIGGKQRRA
jgi:hypothetical protein